MALRGIKFVPSVQHTRLAMPLPPQWAGRPLRLIDTATIPVVVRAMVPGVVASRVGTVMLAIVPAVIGVPVQLVVPADMRARMPIAVPAVVPVVLSGLIPTLVVVVMC